jgi:hypothetical protein
VYSRTIIYTATDGCLNFATCTNNYNWTVDTTPPSITCSSVTVQCASEVPPVGTNTVSVSDNCGPVTLTWLGDVTNSLGCVNHFMIMRTYKATDGCGNTNGCTQIITVNDTTPPVAVCTNITVNLNSSGLAFITAADVNNGSYDNCFGPVTLAVNRTIFGCGDIGPNAVTLTVTDQCGNSNTCSATVTVHDVTAPTISCPANVTTNANTGQCSATGVVLGTATASDNCGAFVGNNAPSSFPVGTNFVVWTAMDASGNSTTCTQQVVVVDNQSPLVSCPADTIVTVPDDMTCACGPQLGSPTVSDNCAVASVTNDAPSCFDLGTNFVVWTVADIHGNNASCTQQVVVVQVAVDSSNFSIVGIEAIGDDINLTWQTFGNSTNVIQLATPIVDGNYTNNYIDLDMVVVPGSGAVITNWIDYGGATNVPSRFYRIHFELGQPCSP